MKFYAGIGSRSTPPHILKLMTLIAGKLALDGFTLRSGHADGADWAFEQGAGPHAEIYLPWARFNSHYPITAPRFAAPTHEAMIMAAQFHPAWNSPRMGQGAKKLHARNMHQILGYDLKTPVKFVICYAELDEQDQPRGGTAQAIRLAESRRIPVFNLVHSQHLARLERYIAPANGLVVAGYDLPPSAG